MKLLIKDKKKEKLTLKQELEGATVARAGE